MFSEHSAPCTAAVGFWCWPSPWSAVVRCAVGRLMETDFDTSLPEQKTTGGSGSGLPAVCGNSLPVVGTAVHDSAGLPWVFVPGCSGFCAIPGIFGTAVGRAVGLPEVPAEDLPELLAK